MNSSQAGYAEREFRIGPELVCRVGISANYSDGGMLEVNVKSFLGSTKASRDTLSAKREEDAIEEIIDEVAREADPYSYLRMIEPGAEKCKKKSAGACDECCKYEYLSKCSAPETAEVAVPLSGEQLAEFERNFRIVLREGIKELVIEA